MIRRPGWIAIGILAVVSFRLATIGPAPSSSDRLILGRDYTLPSEGHLDGDLTVIGGQAHLEENSRVAGNVVGVFSKLVVAGRITGDLTVIGGEVDLQPSAIVEGDLVVTGGHTHRSPAARIHGSQANLDQPEFQGQIPPDLPLPEALHVEDSLVASWLKRTFTAVGWSLIAALLAAGLVSAFPRPLTAMGQTIFTRATLTEAIGILTGITLLIAIPLLIITICLSPLGIALALAALLATVAGWVALGTEVGDRLLRATQTIAPSKASAAALGTGLVSLVTIPLLSIPCLGVLLVIALGSLSLGAAVLTRFGTQSVIRDA